MTFQAVNVIIIAKDWPLFEELFGSSFQKQVSVHTRIPNTHHCVINLIGPLRKDSSL